MKVTPTSTPASEDTIDSSNLELLVGYHLRRASLAATSAFMDAIAEMQLRPVDFSVLNLLLTNSNVTSRQVCRALGVLPPNMVGVISGLEKRGALVRRKNERDKRSEILQLTASGKRLIVKAQEQALMGDMAATAKLTARERVSIVRLLKKIYVTPTDTL